MRNPKLFDAKWDTDFDQNDYSTDITLRDLLAGMCVQPSTDAVLESIRTGGKVAMLEGEDDAVYAIARGAVGMADALLSALEKGGDE